MIAILKISRRLLCLAFVFLSTQLPAQTVDTDCREFGGRINCTSKVREPVENSWVTLQKTLDSIAESRRLRKAEKERQLEQQDRSKLLDLEIKRREQENAVLWHMARVKTFNDYNNKKYLEIVSAAILDGRCDDAAFLALKRSDLDTAQKSKSLCSSKNEMKFPIYIPKSESEKSIMNLFTGYWTGKRVQIYPEAIAVLGGEHGYRKSIKKGLLFLDYAMRNKEPDAFYLSAMLRITLGVFSFDPKTAYIIYRTGFLLDNREYQKDFLTEIKVIVSLLSEKEKSDADAYINSCADDLSKCLATDKFSYNS